MYLFCVHLLIGSEKYCEMSEYIVLFQKVVAVTMVLKKHKTWCASLCHTLGDMRQSSSFSDVIIRADNGRVFTAHACVLAAASPVLKTQLLASHHYLDMSNISDHIWEVMLQFIYTGALKIENTSEIPSILETCELLELTGLITLCRDLLVDNKQEVKHIAKPKTHPVSHKVATRSQGEFILLLHHI